MKNIALTRHRLCNWRSRLASNCYLDEIKFAAVVQAAHFGFPGRLIVFLSMMFATVKKSARIEQIAAGGGVMIYSDL
jgi:hypothetical protein